MKTKIWCVGSGILICSTFFCCVSCNSPQQASRIDLKWEKNQSNLNANASICHIKCEATVWRNGVIDNGSDIVLWTFDKLPQCISETHIERFIEFTFDQSYKSASQSFVLTAVSGNLTTTSKFAISAYEPPKIYDNVISLSKTEGTLDYANGLKKIDITATVTGISKPKLNWNVPTLPEYFKTPAIVIDLIKFESTITFEFEDSIEATDADIYNINVSTDDDSAAPKNFILKTKDWEVWQNNWIPRDSLKINGSGVLSGIQGSEDLTKFDTLHIPREVLSVSTKAFENENNKLLPSNIINLDLSASKIQKFGDQCFQNSTFTNDLVLPISTTSTSDYCFDSSTFESIDLSHCDNLTTINIGAFAANTNAKTIKLNDNLETFVDPSAYASGAFDGNSKPTTYEGNIVLPQKLKSIGVQAFKELGTDDSSSGVSFDWTNCLQLQTIKAFAFSHTKFTPNSNVVIPNTVTQIAYVSFEVTKNITSVTIPNSISSSNGIDTYAFQYCEDLKTVRIEKIERNNGGDYVGLKYSDTLYNPKTSYFSRWLQGTKIDKDASSNPIVHGNSKIEVPNILKEWYKNNWPVRFKDFFVGY